MSFATMVERAGDHPNAFKLALRMATAMSCSPKESKDGWKFVIDKPSDVPDVALARVLVQAALQQIPKYQKTEVLASGSEIYIACPRHSEHATRPELPLQQITSNLRKLQTSLANNWQCDSDGNFRHSATFAKYNFEAGWFLNALGLNPTNDVLYNGSLLYPRDSNDDCAQVLAMPKNPLPRRIGGAKGLCLTPDQVGQLARHVGFISPVNSK